MTRAAESREANRRLLFGVMFAVGVWGGLLSLGAFLFGYDETSGEVHFAPNAVRGLVVLGCVSVFFRRMGSAACRSPASLVECQTLLLRWLGFACGRRRTA